MCSCDFCLTLHAVHEIANYKEISITLHRKSMKDYRKHPSCKSCIAITYTIVNKY